MVGVVLFVSVIKFFLEVVKESDGVDIEKNGFF